MKRLRRNRLALVTAPGRQVMPPRDAPPAAQPSAAAERPGIRGLSVAGLVVIFGFFGGMAAWSSSAPLSSAAIAQGEVSIETKRKLVQHLEGGIVKQIMVREGQQVSEGDVLLVLEEAQARASVDLLRSKIASAGEQTELLKEELGLIERLYEQGLARKPRLLALRRSLAELEGQRIQDQARLAASQDTLERAKIRSSVSGTVVGLKANSVGGVIAPGSELMSIVPGDERLVVEARVHPNDIDVVQAGLSAQVQLTPFSARVLPPIPGRVATVSADRMSDERTGEDYYLAQITLLGEPDAATGGLELTPGMPVQVSIVTGARTFLSYLTAPLIKSFDRAFRED